MSFPTAESSSPILEVSSLTKIFGSSPQKALSLLGKGHSKEHILKQTNQTVGVHKASFSVNEGEIFVIMGLSGSGKSTLVRLLNRLIEPDEGSVIMKGQDITQMSPKELVQFRLHHMSMVFQSFALMPHLTVLENVAFGLELAGVPKPERNERAMETLESVGLKAWAASLPEDLSGGMQQRVGLARGLTVNPDIMLMDEAFSALDPLIKTEMQDELLHLQAEHKRTIVFISHDISEALRIGDRIAIMQDGKIIQIGTPEDILQNPENDYVRSFFKSVNPSLILSAANIASKDFPTVVLAKNESIASACKDFATDQEHIFILSPESTLLGILTKESLQSAITENSGHSQLNKFFTPHPTIVLGATPMQKILSPVTHTSHPVPVVDKNNKFLGAVSKKIFLNALDNAERYIDDSQTSVEKETSHV